MRTLLDFRGIALHCHFRRNPTIQETLESLVKDYLVPLAQDCSILDFIAVHEGGNHLRRSWFPEYKAHRAVKYTEEQSKVIHEAQAACEELITELGILQVRSDGCEADDTLTWLCHKLPGPKRVVTGDKDLIQLASDEVEVIIRGAVRMDMDGVLPKHIALYKSIVGDSSDGYGGVPGLGQKSWDWLDKHLNLDMLDIAVRTGNFRAIEQLAGTYSVLAKLYKERDAWQLCYRLATLHPEEVDRSFYAGGSGAEARYAYRRPKWHKQLPQPYRIRRCLETYQSDFLWNSLLGFIPDFRLYTGELEFTSGDLLELTTSPIVSLDFETVSPPHEPFLKASEGRGYVDVYGANIVGAGLTFGRHGEFTRYLNFGHKGDVHMPLEELKDILEQIPSTTPVLAHNASFEIAVLQSNLNMRLRNVHDTIPMCSHVDEDGTVEPTHDRDGNEDGGSERVSQDLKGNVMKYLGYRQTHYDEVVPKGQTMADMTAEEVFRYGADDPLCTLHLYYYLKVILEIEGTWDFVRDQESPTIQVLVDAFLDGVTLDVDAMAKLAEADSERREDLIAQMRHVLETNQTPESIEKGALNVFQEERQLLQAKSRLEGWTVDRLQREELTLLGELRSTLKYRPYERRERNLLDKFEITPGKLPAICEAFGLTALADLKPATIETYARLVDNADSTERQLEFAGLLLACSRAGEFSPKKRGLNYQNLRMFCYDHLPKRYEYVGTELNLGSPKQLQRLLYGMLGLPYRIFKPEKDKGKTRERLGLSGSPQTDKDAVADALANVLKEGDWRRDVLTCLTEAKACDTRISLFYNKWPLWVHPLDGQVHPGIRSCGTKTRRPAGNSPNVLQLPKRGEKGVMVRKTIKPNAKRGHKVFFSLDFVQEELVLLAGQCKDPALFDCYKEDPIKDVHSITTAGFVKMTLEEFEARRHSDKLLESLRVNKGKATNFGKVYGLGKVKMARKLLIPENEAQQWLDGFDVTYPGVSEWKQAQWALLRRQGYLVDLMGNRIHVYDKARTMSASEASGIDRQVISKLIQGLAASYLKFVLAECWRRRLFTKYDATFSFPIYDELAGSCHAYNCVEFLTALHEIMTIGIPGLGLPMRADISIGPSFGEQIECGRYPDKEKIEEALKSFIKEPLWYRPALQPVCYFKKDDIIDVGFGMAALWKDDELVFTASPREESYMRGGDAEDLALADPDHDWKIELEGALGGGVWQRQGPDQWVLISRSKGFA